MKHYTEDEVLDLMERIDNPRDLKEFADYMKEHKKAYTLKFLKIINNSILLMRTIF